MRINAAMLEAYLDRVMLVASHRDGEAQEIRHELADHLYAKVEALVAEGLSYESAIMTTLKESGNAVAIGYRLRDPWRWVDIRTQGIARGVIAIGPGAIGIIAIGGWSVGVLALGGAGVGVFSIAGAALGLIAWGGLSIGLFATGGLAIGLIAVGGMAIGGLAHGSQTFSSPLLSEGFLAPLAPWVRSFASAQPKFSLLISLLTNTILIPLMVITMYLEQKRIRLDPDRENELWLE